MQAQMEAMGRDMVRVQQELKQLQTAMYEEWKRVGKE